MSTVHQRSSDPPGVLPRYARHILLGGIAAVVLSMSIWSGPSAKRQSEQNANNPVTSAGARQLKEFQAMLERERQQGIRKQQNVKQLEDLRTERIERAGVVNRASERDPAEELMRRKAAVAPFAPLTVLSIEEPKEELSHSSATQVVLSAELAPNGPAGKPDTSTTTSTGSGVFLPEREGDLYRIYEGTLVRTVLTNRLDGTFTGPVMCAVSEPVLSSDGTVLIPKGARFLGEARRVEERNQQRLAIWFDRLLLPNGYSVPLEEVPGLNSVGETGLKDKTNHHYLRRFSFAGAIGLLGGLRLYGGRPEPWGVESGLISGLGNAASSDLARRTTDVPTITIREGHVVNVYLSKDLLMPEYQHEEPVK